MAQKYILDIKVSGLEKIKKEIAGKRYEFVLRVKWSNNTEATIFRPHSMFFDFQGVLSEMFKSYKIPHAPVFKFHWALLGKLGQEKECKSMEEFCLKIVRLPPAVSQASIVLHFFETWGTDLRTNRKSSELFDPVVGRASIQSSQERSKTVHPTDEKEEQYKIIASYDATNIGEISLEEDKFVSIVEKNERGWWFVTDDTGRQGWAPATYLESVASAKDKDDLGYDWISVIDVNGKGEKYVAMVAYMAQNNDELSYNAQEEIEVMEKSNYGWWRVRIKGKVGITPATNLQRANETTLYSSASELKSRTVSISSASGLYAVIRKPPPRRESVRSRSSSGQSQLPSLESLSNGLTGKKPSRFVYSAASFAGGKFIIGEDDKENEEDIRIPDVDAALNQHSETYENVDPEVNPHKAIKSTNSQSLEDPIISINLNQFPDKEHPPYENRKFTKPGDETELEYYSALADYIPSEYKKDDLCLSKRDIVQLISADSGWLFVMRLNGDIERQGWVPENYLERTYDVDMQEFANKGDKVKPKPRPRPLPRPKNKPQEQTNNLLTPVRPAPDPPQRKSVPDLRQTLPVFNSMTRPSLPDINSRPPLSDQSNRSPEEVAKRMANRPPMPMPSSENSSRPPMPAPLLNDIRKSGTPEESDLYDAPGMTLRSVYDAEPWYFGKVSRPDCERLLESYGRQQEFLIRDSLRAVGSYAISIKYCYRIRHFVIEATKDNQLMIGSNTFPNLIEIVQHYQKHPLFFSEHKDHITLGRPFTKDGVPNYSQTQFS